MAKRVKEFLSRKWEPCSSKQLLQINPDILPCFWADPVIQCLVLVSRCNEAVHILSLDVDNPVFPDPGGFVELELFAEIVGKAARTHRVSKREDRRSRSGCSYVESPTTLEREFQKALERKRQELAEQHEQVRWSAAIRRGIT